MTAISITPGYPTFADTDGSPLNDGYVYIGLEYQDPITAPTGAFWDEAFQIPADQPLRTSGGYVVRDGSPAAVYTGAAYSILVQNKNLVTVYNAPSAVITNVTNTVEDITQYQGAHATDPIARNDGTPLQVGDLYFNSVVNELKVWSGSTWVPASPGSVTVQDFTGTGSQTAFNLATAPVAENNTQIYIDGVYQQKDTYSVAGATINFSTPPSLNSSIEVVSFSIAALGTVDASNVSYNEGGTGAVNTSVQSKLQETVSVKDFGAVGDGVTDDTAAIQSAINNAVSSGVLRIYFPKGNYRTVNPVGPLTEAFNLTFYGDGLQVSIITADHLNGPAVTFNRSQSGMFDMSVHASATRKAGAAGSGSTANSGIYMEADDVAGKAIAQMQFHRVRVLDHPANGFVQVGLNQLSQFNGCLAQDNGGHGYVFDSGTLSGRTNTSYVGLVTMDTCWSVGNTGHGIVIGNPSDGAWYGNTRFLMLNCEFSDNAVGAGTRYQPEDAWIRCHNVTFLNCAFGGNVIPSPQIGDIYFMGRNLQIQNQRSVQRGWTLELAVDTYTPATYGILINGLRVLNVAQDPVIKVSDTDIDSGAVRDITVNTLGANDNITTLISGPSAAANNVGGVIWDQYPPVQTAVISGPSNLTSQSFTSTTTLTNITGLSVDLLPNQTVSFEAQIRYAADPSGDLKIGVSGPAGSTIRWQNTGSVYIAADNSIIVSSSDITESGSRIFGAVTGTRIVSFVGVVTVGSTAGALTIQGAQGTSNATPTNIGNGSYLKVIRDNIL